MPLSLRLRFHRAALVVATLVTPLLARAQASSATLPWSAAVGAHVNWLTPHDHALLLRVRLDRSFDAAYNNLDRSASNALLQRAVVLAGFEWRLNQRWSGGVVEKVSLDPGSTYTYQTGGFLRHCGHIGSVQFRKRALAEHVATSISGKRLPSQSRIRLRVDLDRTWQVGAVGLRPRLAYEVQFDVLFEKLDPLTKSHERTVDRAVLRAELGVELGSHITLVPYVARQTEFSYSIAQFDADGNEQVPEGRRNLRYPTVGLDIRYTLFAPAPHTPLVDRSLSTFEGFQD